MTGTPTRHAQFARPPSTLGLTALLLAGPVAAQERPPMEPTRDVAVTYRFTNGQGEARQGDTRMSAAWLASERLLRVDLPQGAGWGLHDRRNGRVRIVMEPMRMVMEMPTGELGRMGIPTEPSASARFTREGTDRVAGLPCTVWRYEDGSNSGRACMTADGVMLRGEGRSAQGQGGMEAVEVSYAAQDPARFRVPAGYQAMQLPQGLPPGLAGALPGMGGAVPGGAGPGSGPRK